MIELIKLWNLTHNIVEISVYMNCHDMFMIMITWTWHDMNCHCLTAWCCLKTTSNLKIMKKMSLKITFSDNLLKYVRYELNCFTCLHKNKITKYLLSQWKILRKLYADLYFFVFEKYHNLIDVFERQKADKLILH